MDFTMPSTVRWMWHPPDYGSRYKRPVVLEPCGLCYDESKAEEKHITRILKEKTMNEKTPVIRVDHLHKRYGTTVAVNDISFEVQPGEIFGLVGPNGAGKTTTVECLEGLRRPDGGCLSVLGMDLPGQGRQLRQRIGVQLQQAALPGDIKVWEALDLFASIYHHKVRWQLLMEDWGLAEKRNARFGSLSGGQKQRLFVILALVNDPEVVFLDEITTGLDPQARRSTWEMVDRLRQEGKTVLLVTHFMEEAEQLCDRVGIIDHGRLIALDTPQKLIRRLEAETKVTFRARGAENYQWLAVVAGVSQVSRQNGNVVVSGRGPLLVEVAAALAQRGQVPDDLRLEQATLEDVFLALTGKQIRD
jgi:ABC-2 type transport system ATP-binding protein